jgi:hypothetical protein
MSIESLQSLNTEKLIIWGAAVYLMSMLVYSYVRLMQINNWPYVVGRLKKADVDYMHVIARSGAYENVRYEYEVGGQKFIGKRLSPFLIRGQVGPLIKKQLSKIHYVSNDQVKVFYSPREPSKSYLVKTIW